MSAIEAILGRVMLGFEGERLPDWVAARLANAPAAGMTVFRHHNVRTPGQVLELTEGLQRAGADGHPGRPMLVAADQEGGQLQALGDGATAFPGNMALGAVGDEGLAERVGLTLATEARAMGVNVLYAPDLDVATNPRNVALGIRSFGDDPAAVARLGAAVVRGITRAGAAATVKHFPGKGDVSADTHHELARIGGSRDRLEAVELPPFRAGIAAGARLVMSSHAAVPGLTGDPSVPGTLARAVMTDLLRRDLGFNGVTISDALDMGALAQGEAQRAQMVEAANAGVDLFLCAADRAKLQRIEGALVAGVHAGAIDPAANEAALGRIDALRRWLGSQEPGPDLAVVGCAAHQALALEVATRALTRFADPMGWLPLAATRDQRIVAVMPTPTDMTPADTSSTVTPGLAGALRVHHARVDEIVVAPAPDDREIAAVRDRVAGGNVAAVVVGTLDGVRSPGQIELVRVLAATGRPTIAVSMRTPWDLAAYPPGVAAVATYSIHPAAMAALAAALFGQGGWPGVVPVRVTRA